MAMYASRAATVIDLSQLAGAPDEPGSEVMSTAM
jgi:hypothetical protein